MKKAFLTITLVLCSLLSFSFIDEEGISIRISSPDTKKTYQAGDTVWLKASVNAPGALHDVSLKVVNLKDSSVVFSKVLHSHSSSMTIREFYINPVTEKSDMSFVISMKGHDGKESARNALRFKCAARKKR